jgi:hypothetical protein
VFSCPTLLSHFDTCACLLQVIGPRAVELCRLLEEMTKFYRQEENRECHALQEVQ